MLIQDRRSGLEAADYRLDGIEAKIYLACDAGATAAEICRKLKAEGNLSIDASEIGDYLQQLVRARLMYREGKSFLLWRSQSAVKEICYHDRRQKPMTPRYLRWFMSKSSWGIYRRGYMAKSTRKKQDWKAPRKKAALNQEGTRKSNEARS